VAAWGLFEKKDIQTLSRVASARTMDGYKIRAKLALNFQRAVANAEAEDVMMQYARAFATAVECELSNGDLPFEEHELHQRMTDAVQALPKKSVRLIGLHVWHRGAISSGSMLAVKPEGKATVPAMPAVSVSRTLEKSPPQAAAHSATTVRPDPRSDFDPTSSNEPPSVRGQAAVSVQAPDSVERAAAARTATSPSATRAAAPASATRPAMTQAQLQAQRAPTSANLPATRVSTTSTSAVSAKTPTASMPAVSAKAPTVSMPAVSARSSASMPASRMLSGVVPAVEPRIQHRKSGFLVALEQTTAETGDDVGQAMAQPIRDAAAGLLLATLDALHGSIPDPLSLFDGRGDPALRRALIGEACVCVCYVLYESLTRTSLPQMQGIQVVQAACVRALCDENMPVSEISRYLATESPREEFSSHTCALLGTRETTELQQRVETVLRGLRIDVKTCAEQIESRLTRPRAAGGR
jgi:hypothetical protein